MIGIVTWPVAVVTPGIDVDSSWVIGLHVAARQALSFGSDIVFTYGPLGFLGFPEPWVAWTSGLALVFVGSIQVALCAISLHIAREAIGRRSAAILVFATSFTFSWIAGWTMYGVLIFLAAASAILRRSARPSGSALAIGLGFAIGVAGLGKVNIALVSLVISTVAVMATARDPRRSIAVFGTAIVVTFLAIWIAVGQHLGDVPGYLRGAFEITLGYSDSLGQVDPQTGWGAGIVAIGTAMLVYLAWLRSADLPRRDRVALITVLAIMLLATYKAGFTRAGIGMAIDLVTVIALWPVVIPRSAPSATVSVFVGGILASVLALTGSNLFSMIDPAARASAFLDQGATVLTRRGETSSSTRASLRTAYDLPPEAVRHLAGRTVDIQPWDAAIACAYPELVWRPEPVFQAYSAYTPELDAMGAGLLRGPEAPARILWFTRPGFPLSIDGRGVWFDSPAAKIEMLCRYRPLASTPGWQVLEHRSDRCGAPIVVAAITTHAGDRVSIPTPLPSGILTLRIDGVGKDPLSRLVSLAYKAPPWWVTLGASRYRIPLGTAGEAAVIAVTTDVGYRDALALGSPPDALVIGPGDSAPGDGSPLEVELAVIPVSPWP